MTRSIPNVSSVFADALACETPQQLATLLEDACGSNAAMRRQVERLLAAHHQASGFLGSATADIVDPSIGVGKVIGGRYKLLEPIGEGGMGTVWVAEQTEPVRRKVAIKLVKAGMDSKQVLVRFQAERQALALMDHPNIAKVLDGGATDHGRPFFAMEYVKGVPITRYCDDCHLPLRERLKLFVSVCQAVQHAHQKGIIHRDLKPSNILVCQYDGQPVVKVIDFGLAKAVNQPLTTQTLHTAHGIMIGTPLYMSPEQAEFNNLDVDTRTDIYSLGVVLYELLTGSTPLEKQQIQRAALEELLRLIKEVEPARPSTRLSTSATLPSVAAQRGIDPKQLGRLLKGDLDWIVMKSLEKDRGRRYETANGMARDIERFLAEEAVEAGPPSARYRLRKLMYRYRGPLLGASAVAAALVIGMIATTLAMFEARRQTQLAEVAAFDEGQARLRAERAESRANEQLELVRLEKARADAEAARAIAANGFMRNLLGAGGSEGAADGPEIRDRRIFDVITAASAALDGLKEQPLLELDGRLTLAATYVAIGDLDKARAQYKRAAELSKTLNGAESDATLQIEIDYLFASQRATSKADLELARRLVKELTARHGADHPLTCDANNSLAFHLARRGNRDEAGRIYKSIVEAVRRRPDVFHPKGKARYVSNLASFVKASGNEEEYDELVIEAAAICDHEPHTDPWRCFHYYTELGEVYVKQHRFTEALGAWKSAFDRSASLGMSYERKMLIDELIRLSAYLDDYDHVTKFLNIARDVLEHEGAETARHYGPQVDVALAENLFRSGDRQAGRKLIAKIEQSLHTQMATDPKNEEWIKNSLGAAEMCKRGTYNPQAWASPALGVAADMMLRHTVSRHVTGPESPSLDWDGLRIDLYRWEGPDVEVTEPVFRGSLAELSHHDPAQGLYLLAFDLPRDDTFSAKELAWVLHCDWELAIYDADALKLDRLDPWPQLEQATPFLQRRGSVAYWQRRTLLDSFAGYGMATNKLATGCTRLTLPRGTYECALHHDGEGEVWVDGAKINARADLEFGDQARELKFIWQGTNWCYPAIEPRCEAKERLTRRAVPTVHWANCDVELVEAKLSKQRGDLPLSEEYARALCRAGRFEEAADVLAPVEHQSPDDHYSTYQLAVLACYTGDLEQYRRLCTKLRERFPDEGLPVEVGERTAKCHLLLPPEILGVDLNILTSRIDRAANASPSELANWFYQSKGWHLYRLGDDHAAEAVEWLDRSIAAWPGGTPPPMCYYLRAMALQKSGRSAEAAEAFHHAEEFHATHGKVLGRDDLGEAVENWIFEEMIAKEAREMFKAEPQAP